MAWVETESLSFTARHESEDEPSAQRILDALEDLRLRSRTGSRSPRAR